MLQRIKCLFGRHVWRKYHPVYYQPHVRQFHCTWCNTIRHEGQRGESGRIVPLGVDDATGQALYGYREGRIIDA